MNPTPIIDPKTLLDLHNQRVFEFIQGFKASINEKLLQAMFNRQFSMILDLNPLYSFLPNETIQSIVNELLDTGYKVIKLEGNTIQVYGWAEEAKSGQGFIL